MFKQYTVKKSIQLINNVWSLVKRIVRVLNDVVKTQQIEVDAHTLRMDTLRADIAARKAADELRAIESAKKQQAFEEQMAALKARAAKAEVYYAERDRVFQESITNDDYETINSTVAECLAPSSLNQEVPAEAEAQLAALKTPYTSVEVETSEVNSVSSPIIKLTTTQKEKITSLVNDVINYRVNPYILQEEQRTNYFRVLDLLSNLTSAQREYRALVCCSLLELVIPTGSFNTTLDDLEICRNAKTTYVSASSLELDCRFEYLVYHLFVREQLTHNLLLG